MPIDPTKFQARRAALGLTQAQLAERAGMHQTRVSEIERGDNLDPRLSTIEALARALGCRVDQLLEKGKVE